MSQAQDDRAPSTGLATEADNQAQADPEPSTADGASSVTEEKDDTAGIAAQGDPGPSSDQTESAATATQGDQGPSTGHAELAAIVTPDDSGPSTGDAESAAIVASGDSGPSTGQAESAAMETSDDSGPSTEQGESAAMAAQGDPGPGTDQGESAATATQADPGPSTDQAASASATGQGDSAAISARDGSPRHTVQGGSEPIERQDNVPIGLTVLSSSSHCDPATEPTRPPNSLTTIPTAEDQPLEKGSASQLSITKESGSNLEDPQTSSTPPQVNEGASGSQANQPQNLEAVEGQDVESKQTKEEQATTESRRVAHSGTDEIFPDPRRSDEDNQEHPSPTSIARLSSPHHRDAITPKPILKKNTGTANHFGPDGVSEPLDPSGGTKLFWGTVANYKATRHRRKLEEEVLDVLHTETESGAGTPRLEMELNAISGGDNSDGESEEKVRRGCSARCNLL